MNNREDLLEQKRQEILGDVRRWAAANHILRDGEIIIADLRIYGGLKDIKLPPDKLTHDGEAAEIWNLTEEDWEKLAKLDWNSNEKKFLDLLRSHKNGPLHVSRIIDHGIEWSKRHFVLRFNHTLFKGANDYHSNRETGAHYKLKRPLQSTDHYAIWKFQRVKK